MSKPMSKTKVVGHLAEKVGTPKKTAAMFFDELFKLAVREDSVPTSIRNVSLEPPHSDAGQLCLVKRNATCESLVI